MNLRTFTICWLAILLSPIAVDAGAVIYVDADSPGGDGSSWAAAFEYLQDALAVADANDEIRVAQGTYIADQNSVNPDGSGDRQATFQLISSVAICGGYAGSDETDPNERDTKVYETILSGDSNGDDGPNFANNDENSYHVVTGSGTDPNAILDGFIITSGNANGERYPSYQDCGGGMHTDSGSPTVIDCTFTGNSAELGGGMYNRNAGPRIANCTFSENSARSSAGMYNSDSSPILTNCAIIRNSGGGMYNSRSSPILTNCTFRENPRCGMSNNYSDLTLMNCTFSGNEVHGIQSHDGSQTLTNCIFTGNISQDEFYGGGGMWIGHNCNSVLINCILWGNIAESQGPQIAMDGGVLTVSYCNIQGAQLDISGGGTLNWLDGNIGEDLLNDNPLFARPGYWDFTAWVEGDYHLKSQAGRWDTDSRAWVIDTETSPCIDAGNPNSGWTAELWPHGKCANMGAFGGTPQASMSESSLGNRADLDCDGFVNFGDFAGLVNWWRTEGPLRAEDLNRDAIVNFFDILQFVEEWLWQEI